MGEEAADASFHDMATNGGLACAKRSDYSADTEEKNATRVY